MTPIRYFIIVILIVLARIDISSCQKSLFDDLPLNGAYNPETPDSELQLEAEVAESNSEEKLLIPNNPNPSANNEEKEKTNKYLISSTSVNSSENSLFDALPNQGAITIDQNSPEYIFDSKTQKRGVFATDTELSRLPNGLRFQLDIEKQPVTEISVKSETSSDVRKLFTVLSPPSLPPIQGLEITLKQRPSGNRQNGLYQTPSRNHFPPIGVMHREKIPRVSTVYGTPKRNLKPQSESGRYLRKEIHYYNNFRNTGWASNHDRRFQGGYEVTTQPSTTAFPVIAPAPTTTKPAVYGGYDTSQNVHITSTTSTPTSSPPLESTVRPNSENWGDYDYDTLDETRKGSSGGIIDRRVFGSRTGFYRTNFNVPSVSYSPPQEYQRNTEPDNSYGAPSQTYGPPPTEPPTVSPSYGPPTSPPLQSDPPITSSSTTSISYQTIPVQTIQTQLITVPQITVSASSPVESESGIDDGFARPQSPGRPSTAYGAPGPTQAFARQTTRGPLFTDDQLALLISASRGTVGTNLFEDDSASLITGNRGFGSNLADVLGGGTRFGINPLIQPTIQIPSRGIHNIVQQPQTPLFLPQNRFQGIQSFGGNRAVLTGDAVETISDILREQRLRDSVTDLRGRLRQETRTAERTRQNYRSLFYKGALLLGALSLLPTVATPIAAAAGATPSFLLPLANGRRKREIGSLEFSRIENGPNFTIIRTSTWEHGENNHTLFPDPKLEFTKKALVETESLFNSMNFKGAMVPENIKSTLQKYLSPEDIVRNSKCVQKRFCETLVEIQSLPKAETFLFLYATFANEVETNPWIQEAMTAARKGKCEVFYCFQDYLEEDKLG